MIVGWALGGGLGHLTRIRAWHHSHRREEPLVLATVSAHAPDQRVTGPAAVVELARPDDRPDPAMLRRRLAGLLADPAVTELVIDAFPAGLVGELDGLVVPDHVRVTHLARLLRWDVYRERIGPRPPRIDQVHLLEQLDPTHLRWLQATAGTTTAVEVTDPPPGWPPSARPIPPTVTTAPDGIIVAHSGPIEEVTSLLRLALQRPGEGVLAAPPWCRPASLPSRVVAVDLLPAWPLFARAGLVMTGGGWNSVRQGAALARRFVVVPFRRALDDQHCRVARLRRPARARPTAAGTGARSTGVLRPPSGPSTG